jgi:hypothetical protein
MVTVRKPCYAIERRNAKAEIGKHCWMPFAAGPPYQVQEHHIHAMSTLQVLTELERRGLITSDALPVLTEAGIAEARWFANSDGQIGD